MQKQVDYSEAIKTKYPEQVVIAIAKDEKGKANPVTLGWTMIASGEPPMMAIARSPIMYSSLSRLCIRGCRCGMHFTPQRPLIASSAFLMLARSVELFVF